MTLLWMFFLGTFLPEIIILSPASLLKPGENFTLTVQIKGTQTEGTLVLPEGWKMINTFKMEKEEGYTRFFTLNTDQHLASGKYILHYRLNDHSAEDSLQVEIQAFSRLEVTPLNLPDIAREGDTLRFSYFLENKGNHPELLYYSSCAGPGDSLWIHPGESRTLSFTERIPFEIESYLHQTEILYQGEFKRYYQNVSVFLSKSPSKSKEETWPLEVGVRWLGYVPGRSTYQFFAIGSGQMGDHKLDINLRGPNRLEIPMFGFYDQYYLGYTYKKTWGADLGDFSLRFSPLVELGRFGRGAQVWTKAGRSQFKVFYHQPRFYSRQRNSWGGEWEWSKNKSTFSLLSYNKTMATLKEWKKVNIGSANYRFKNKVFDIEQDVAISNSESGIGLGLLHRFNYTGRKWFFQYQGIYSDKHYYGFYTNSKLSNAQLSYKLFKRYLVGVQHYYSYLMAQPDLHEFYISPKHQYLTGFVNAQFNSRQNLYLYYQQGERSDTLSPYHFRERFIGLNYLYNGRNFRFTSNGRQGSTLNLLVDDQKYENLTVLSLQPSVQLFPNFWLGALGEFQNTTRFSSERENLFYWGGSVQYYPSSRFQFMVNYRSSFAQDEVYRQQSLLQVYASTNWSNHNLSLQGGKSYFPTPDGKGFETLLFNLSYSYKIGMPTKKRVPKGRVSGMVQGTGVPVEGMLLYLGDKRFMTDASGRFDFGKVNVGQHQLLVKSLHAGINYPEKMQIDVAQKVKNTYIIPVFKGGIIRGKISMPNNLQRVWVYLEHEGQISTVLTKADGSFSFSGLEKGDYTVYLQLDHFEIPEPVKLSLDEGAEVQVPLQIRTKQRTIQFQSTPLQIKR